jgi:hypothetical protein
MDDNERTLCSRCKNNYIDAGFKLVRLTIITNKDYCDICGRLEGYTYKVVEYAIMDRTDG